MLYVTIVLKMGENKNIALQIFYSLPNVISYYFKDIERDKILVTSTTTTKQCKYIISKINKVRIRQDGRNIKNKVKGIFNKQQNGKGYIKPY